MNQVSLTRRQFLKSKDAASKQLQFLDEVSFSRISRKSDCWTIEITPANLKKCLKTAEIEKKLRAAIKARDAAIDARGNMALYVRDSKRDLAEARKEASLLRKQTTSTGELQSAIANLKRSNAALMQRIRELEANTLEDRQRFHSRQSANNIFNGSFKPTSRGAVGGGLPGHGKRK